MNDKEYKAEKDRINSFLIPMKNLLLSEWNLSYIYHRNYHEENRETMATCIPNWEYKQAVINLYVPSLNDNCVQNSEMVRTLLHELVHCMLGPMTPPEPEDDRHRAVIEFTTQTVTDNILRMFENPKLFTTRNTFNESVWPNERKSANRKKIAKKVSKS